MPHDKHVHLYNLIYNITHYCINKDLISAIHYVHACSETKTETKTKSLLKIDPVQCGISESKPDGSCEARSKHCTLLTAASGVWSIAQKNKTKQNHVSDNNTVLRKLGLKPLPLERFEQISQQLTIFRTTKSGFDISGSRRSTCSSLSCFFTQYRGLDLRRVPESTCDVSNVWVVSRYYVSTVI